MNEIWKDINGYKGLYQVSNLGNVKSLRFGKEKFLKTEITIYGYCRVTLTKNKQQHHYAVHRLVYEAFYGKIPFWMQVNHINENKTDNRLCNLNIMTPKANTNWGTCIERRIKNRKGKTALKRVVQYSLDENYIKEWSSIQEIERELNFNNSNITACCKGRQNTAYGFIWKYSSDIQPIPQ